MMIDFFIPMRLPSITLQEQKIGVEWIEKTPYTFAPAIDGYGRPMLWPGFDAMEDGAGRTEDADR